MRAMRQAWVHGPSLIGGVQHFKEALIDHQGQSLTAVFFFGAQCRPAAFDVLGISIFEAGGCGHFMGVAIEFATFFVTRHIQGEDHFGRKFTALFQHRIDGVGVGVGMLGHGLEFIFQIEQLVQHKLKVTQGRGIAGHVGLSEN